MREIEYNEIDGRVATLIVPARQVMTTIDLETFKAVNDECDRLINEEPQTPLGRVLDREIICTDFCEGMTEIFFHNPNANYGCGYEDIGDHWEAIESLMIHLSGKFDGLLFRTMTDTPHKEREYLSGKYVGVRGFSQYA